MLAVRLEIRWLDTDLAQAKKHPQTSGKQEEGAQDIGRRIREPVQELKVSEKARVASCWICE
jgi:hypothetical protein